MLSGFIIFKLLSLLRKGKLGFINAMFLLAYVVQITFGTTFVKYLYNIGYTNIYKVESGNGIEEDCKYFITFYTIYITYFPMSNCTIIFCRYVYIKY